MKMIRVSLFRRHIVLVWGMRYELYSIRSETTTCYIKDFNVCQTIDNWWMDRDWQLVYGLGCHYTCHHFFVCLLSHRYRDNIGGMCDNFHTWKKQLTFVLGLFKLQLDGILIARCLVTYLSNTNESMQKITPKLASSLPYATSTSFNSPVLGFYQGNRCSTILLQFSFFFFLLFSFDNKGSKFVPKHAPNVYHIIFNQFKRFFFCQFYSSLKFAEGHCIVLA